MFSPRAQQPTPAAATIHLPTSTVSDRAAVAIELARISGDLPELGPADRGCELDDFPYVADHFDAFVLAMEILDAVLDADAADRLTPRLHAHLIHLAAYPALPEAMALQIAFGRKVAERNVADLARLTARALQRDLTVDEYVADLHAVGAIPSTTATRLFRGEARRRPDADRVRDGIALLRSTAAVAPTWMRPPVLCAIAWLHWARGKRALAVAHLEAALRIDPTHVLAHGLRVHMSSHTPTWLPPMTKPSPPATLDE